MTRQESCFDIIPNAKQMIRERIEREGSQLGRVLARCVWTVEYEIIYFGIDYKSIHVYLYFIYLDLLQRMIQISVQHHPLILHLILMQQKFLSKFSGKFIYFPITFTLNKYIYICK